MWSCSTARATRLPSVEPIDDKLDIMGKNKLKKFADMERMQCVFQFPFAVVTQEGGCPMRGKWNEQYFKNDNPIVLELGCGKGEYAVGDEVSEIWITFPDPQMKKVNKRLTSTRFLDNYRHILCDGGTVHLKTDSPFLYTYTHALVEENHLPVTADTDDLYASGLADDILDIKTHYEMQWLQRGLTIKYIRFSLPHGVELIEPDIDIEPDTYRSYNRGYIQMPQFMPDQEETKN